MGAFNFAQLYVRIQKILKSEVKKVQIYQKFNPVYSNRII